MMAKRLWAIGGGLVAGYLVTGFIILVVKIVKPQDKEDGSGYWILGVAIILGSIIGIQTYLRRMK